MWFERLTGFSEESPEQVRDLLRIDDDRLTSAVNGKSWVFGELEVVSLGDLRRKLEGLPGNGRPITLSEVVADVQNLHLDTGNRGALFQVASQFNLLEMVSPDKTPEKGVGIYERDFTQGPACAIAAGAGTIYRNYFADVRGRKGQTETNQIDCLEDLGELLGNEDDCLWETQNGYALATIAGLEKIGGRIQNMLAPEIDRLRDSVKVGVQWGTQVTLRGASHLVSQVYCSALPVAYSMHSSSEWEEFGRLVLEAAYEATLCAACLNHERNGSNRVFLTLLGGGAFGNDEAWIVAAMNRAFEIHRDSGLDVRIVSFERPSPVLEPLIRIFE